MHIVLTPAVLSISCKAKFILEEREHYATSWGWLRTCLPALSAIISTNKELSFWGLLCSAASQWQKAGGHRRVRLALLQKPVEGGG